MRGAGPPGWGWHRWLGTETGVVLTTVAILPLAVVVVCLAARWRRPRGVPPARAWSVSVAEVGMVYGTVPFVWLTMLPGSRAGQSSGAVSLVPLRDLGTMPTYQVVGNLLVFAALGFFTPVRFVMANPVSRVTVLAAGGSTLIEVAQHVLRLDRVSSVDDILLNTAGAAVAALVSTLLLRGVAALRRHTSRVRPAQRGVHEQGAA